jgi:hypothetical protein
MKNSNTLVLAVITQYLHPFQSIFFRHRGSQNLLVHILNNISPLVFCMNRLFTQGTCDLSRLIEGYYTGSVESVAAGEELDRIPGFMEGFETHRTINTARIVQTDMGINRIYMDTDSTLVTMNMILRTTHPTDSALIAVVLALVLVVQENTQGTPIGAHDGLAGFTDLLGVLNGLTGYAFDLLDRLPIHGMRLLDILFVLILLFVVAEPTRKELVTTRGQKQCSAFIMATP